MMNGKGGLTGNGRRVGVAAATFAAGPAGGTLIAPLDSELLGAPGNWLPEFRTAALAPLVVLRLVPGATTPAAA
ncbi:MAG: hypothetical protein AB7P40_21855 [Chloroflexota bacterium]